MDLLAPRAPVLRRLTTALIALVFVMPSAPAGMVAAADAVPFITTPSPGSTIDGTPILGWLAVPGAERYRVEIAGPAGFDAPLLARTTINRWLTTTEALPAGEVAWRVAAVGSDGTPGSWATATFTNTSDLAAPALVPAPTEASYPTDARVIDWAPVPGAAGYDLRVDGTRDGLATAYVGTVVGHRVNLPISAEDDGTIRDVYWQVRARGAGGLVTGPWSAIGEMRSTWSDSPSPTTPDGASGLEMELDWEPLPGAGGYEIEVQVVGSSEPPIEARADGTRFRFDQYLEGEYRWRVRGTFQAGANCCTIVSPWSSWRTYTVHPAPGPVLLAPSDGATVPGAVRLAWQPVTFATEYRVEVSADPTFASGVSSIVTRDTVVEPGAFRVGYDQPSAPLDFADGVTYHWRVQPHLRPYIHVEWSAVRSFTVDSPPVRLLSPAAGATLDVPTFTWERDGDLLFEITIRAADGTVADKATTQAVRYTARHRLDPAAGPFTWWVTSVGADPGAPVLRRSEERSFAVEPVAGTATEPVILDPPPGASDYLLRWTPVAGAASYDIVTTGANGDNDTPVNEVAIPYPELVAPGWRVSGPDRWGPEPARPQYRVIAYDAAGTELVRGPGRSLPAPLPAAPEAIAPDDCASPSCGSPASPLFRWEPVDGAVYYQLDSEPALVSYATTGTSARLLYPVPGDTEPLTWRVRAVGTAGAGGWSAWRSTWWSRVFPEPIGPGDGATVEDEATVRYVGGTPPQAAPGEEPAWTVQEARLVNQPPVTYVAGSEPSTFRWGLVDDGAPALTFTLQRSTPALLAPADGAIVDAMPVFRVAPQAWARGYGVEIHRGGAEPLGPSTLVALLGSRDAGLVPATPLAPGVYRWRARRADVGGYPGLPFPGTPWSATRTFTVTGELGPELIGPAAGTTIVPGDMLLAWERVAGAAGYRVELSRDPEFTILGYAATSSAPGWAPTAPLSGGTWYWRVQALGAGDQVRATSGSLWFVLDAPLQKPASGQIQLDDGRPVTTAPFVRVGFPTARIVGARRVRLSNDGRQWRTYGWDSAGYEWEVAPGFYASYPYYPEEIDGAYTVYGQWEDLDGEWSAVVSDTIVVDHTPPSITVEIEHGALTTTRRTVEVGVEVSDNDAVGMLVVCVGDRCRTLAGLGGPIEIDIAKPEDPPGPREVCIVAFDIARNNSVRCDTIELVEGASIPPLRATPLVIPVQVADYYLSWPTAGDPLELRPYAGPRGLPAGVATCTWELRWGDHAALRDAVVNGSGGGVSTTGSVAEGFCDAWRLGLPAVPSSMFTVSFTARAVDGSVLATTASDWRSIPRFFAWPPAVGTGLGPTIVDSSLPIVDLTVEGPDAPGEQLTYAATPHGFAPTDAVLSARAPSGAIVTSADARSLSVVAPDEGRWSVRWAGHRGPHLITSYLDPTTTILDSAPPIVSVPVTRPLASRAIGTTVAASVSWSGSDASSAGAGTGIARYELQVSRNGGPWWPVHLSSATSRWAVVSLHLTGSYRYRARAIDGAGNVGSWTIGPPVQPRVAADTAASVRGRWYRAWSSSYYGGSSRWSASRGASATYSFTGSAIGWIARVGPGRGRASVYVDGTYAGSVDLRGSAGSRRLVFGTAWPAVGRHTIKIVVQGTAGRPRVEVDGFVVLR